MKKVHLFIFLLLLSNLVFADPPNICESLHFSQSDSTKVTLMQKVFDGEFQELAIVFQEEKAQEKITRLSFAGSKQAGCHFPAIAVLKGGDWGWHVVWASSGNQGVFYARVDGEAWVSSLPKKLSPDVAELVTLKVVQGKLTITAKYPANLNLAEQQFVSEDEGRSWDSVSP